MADFDNFNDFTDMDNLEIPKDTSKHYSDNGFFEKVQKYAAKIGYTILEQAFLLYFAAKRPECPMKVKAGIYSALGYLILPLDVIPDFTPLVGYVDDAGAIAVAIGLAQLYINDDVRRQTREQLVKLIGEKTVVAMEKSKAEKA